MKLDRRFWRRAASWIAIGAVVYFGNVEFQSWLGRRVLAQMEMTIYSLDEGLSAAASGQKLVVADMSAIWCSSCRTFDQKVLGDDAVQSALEAGFVFVRIEYESEEGKAFRERYGVKGFPTLVLLDADGELLRSLPTTFDPQVFLNALRGS